MAAPDDLRAFCEVEYPRLVAALDLHVGDLHVAEELAQEALVRASQRWTKVSALESPGGWTHRVAMNLATSWWRRRQAEWRANRRATLPATAAKPVGSDRPVLVEAVPATDPADGADRQAVRRAVADLPAKQRTAVVYRYFLDLSADETAARMGTTPGAVRALTKRAVATLRDRLGPDTVTIEEVDHVA